MDLSLCEKESRDLRHPVRYLYRSIIITSSSRHKPREKERKKNKSFDMS